MHDALTLIALIGATLIVTDSTLFAPIRRLWPALLQCAQCAGFWIGVGGSVFVPTGHSLFLSAIIVGCATSFLALLGHAVLVRLLDSP